MKNGAMFTSNSVEWYTPDDLFESLEREFGPFDLDPCAGPDAKPRGQQRYGTEVWSGLAFPWRGKVYCNPPYGRPLPQWVAKAEESAKAGATVVMLLPARTDTKWWHRHIWDSRIHGPRNGVEIRFIEGRIKFANSKWNAPFPSVIVVFRTDAGGQRAPLEHRP